MPVFREQLLRPSIEIFVLVSVRLYRDGIADALQQDRRFRVVGRAASLDSAREALDTYTQAPDLALVDVDLAEGADAVRTLRSAWPATTIVALAVRENDEDVVAWVEAGVSGLVSRDASLAEVLDGVEAAAKGEVLVSQPVAAALIRRVASVADERTVRNGTLLTRRRARDRAPDRRGALEQGGRDLAADRARRPSRTTCTTSWRSCA